MYRFILSINDVKNFRVDRVRLENYTYLCKTLVLLYKSIVLKGEMYYVRDFKRFYRLTEYGHSKWSVHLLSSNLNDVNVNTL